MGVTYSTTPLIWEAEFQPYHLLIPHYTL